MLIEIRSNIFRDKIINFKSGLNVIQGDNEGSNSIGKSTILMIIDFILGGTSYIDHNKDVAKNLGEHKFYFCFEFEGVKSYYGRGTEDDSIIEVCDKEYNKEKEISVAEFRGKLNRLYNLELYQLTFRNFINLFSRVWGKENFNTSLPLHSFFKDTYVDATTRLIKIFEYYRSIEEQDKEIKNLKDDKSLINKAGKRKVIPKINKTTYKTNLKTLENLELEMHELSRSLFSPEINLSNIVSDEVLKLREIKKVKLNEVSYYKTRLARTNKTISSTRTSKFESLREFFPEVNQEKLLNIEEFHEGISSILEEELKKARKEIIKIITLKESDIREINYKLEQIVKPEEKSNVFMDRIMDIATQSKSLQVQNNYYEKLDNVIEGIKDKEKEFVNFKLEISEKIANQINDSLLVLNTQIHSKEQMPPHLEITPTKYVFSYEDNTGTGNAYTNLIILDLSIFKLTKLPLIIHDSFLFKNIEKPVIKKLINVYSEFKKQSFISIDMIDIYDKETQTSIADNTVLKLSKSKTLFNRNWTVKSD